MLYLYRIWRALLFSCCKHAIEFAQHAALVHGPGHFLDRFTLSPCPCTLRGTRKQTSLLARDIRASLLITFVHPRQLLHALL